MLDNASCNSWLVTDNNENGEERSGGSVVSSGSPYLVVVMFW